MTKGERIRARRKELGLTLEAVAAATDTSKQTIQRYENGVIENIPDARLEAIAKALATTPAQLMGWAEESSALRYGLRPLARRAVPLVGRIACGEPIYAEEDFCGYELAGEGVDADFCLRAVGDSMIGARIHDGDIVFVKACDVLDDGEIGVVVIGDEATLKRVYYDRAGQKLILTPENPRYAPLVFSGEELSTVKILGRAVAFQSRLL